VNAVSFRNPIVAGIIALLLVILAASTFAIVPETKQAVILRFGQPIRTVNAWQPNTPFGQTGAGLIARIPFVDRIVWIDKRVQDLELDNTLVLSTDQLRLCALPDRRSAQDA
jgi:membrane protease subunit HflC